MGFALRPGLSFCRVDERAIFLDLSKDRYFCLDEPAASAFEAVAGGRPQKGDDRAREVFARSGLLISVTSDVFPMPCLAPPVSGSLLRMRGDATAMMGVAEAVARRFQTRIALKTFGLERILKAVRRHRHRSAGKVDQGIACRASAAFAGANLICSGSAMCLSISVATMGWLAARRCAATLVLGVKLHPFQAHCWVQVGSQLVNDEVDRVRPFVPILVI